MSNTTDYERTVFLDGLIGYLEIRQWAYDKIKANLAGSSLIDLKMYHFLYFTNLFGVIDLVMGHLSTPDEKNAFEKGVQQEFPSPTDYCYARELRNSIVHRGLDPVMAGTQLAGHVFALCPPVVHNVKATKSYTCSFPLLIDLATASNQASNLAIQKVLNREGLLESSSYMPDKDTILGHIAGAPHMPEWVRAMARKAFASMDFETVTVNVAQSRLNQLQLLLGSDRL